MNMKTKKLVVFGYGQRGSVYASFAQKHPEKIALQAIIENSPQRNALAKATFPNVPIYESYKEFLEAKILADIVAVATQDEQHKEHAIAMMAAGYDLLLEKPISNNREDCLAIYEASKKYGKKVIVCHVLRYTPFYSTVKRVIDEGKLGEVISIHASENVGYYHQAHSFVRGPWANKKASSPMILAKCCHDMDIIRYLMGEKCISVSSFGGLYYFNESHAPENSADYCSECQVENCIYNAQKLYTDPSVEKRWFSSYFTTKALTNENIIDALKGTQYDKCVYKSDNDVVDHEVTIMNFENGKTACHTMTAFSKHCYRDLKIYGTKAELVGVIESNEFEIRTFGGETQKICVDISMADMGGHMGGDFFMMENIYKALNGEKTEGVTYLDVSIESHLMSFAAEDSRLNNGKAKSINE